MFWSILADAPSPSDNSLFIYIGAGVGGLIVLFILMKVLFGSSKGQPDLQKGMRESLADYPPAPKTSGKRLTLNGIAVRLRLLVVCPTGKQHQDLVVDDVGELLDEVIHGLGQFLDADKPRIKIWPPQLSVTGFAPTFHSVVESPDAIASKSPWILAAGPAKAAGKPILLGMAFYADTPVKLGQLIFNNNDWVENLRIER